MKEEERQREEAERALAGPVQVDVVRAARLRRLAGGGENSYKAVYYSVCVYTIPFKSVSSSLLTTSNKPVITARIRSLLILPYLGLSTELGKFDPGASRAF